ncbi:UTP--glucose-1-phosphate uridylyltransferase, partial [Staphylococcus aureus]|uniref:sugar phosphate nucleotidyltransferase n=1 Tax=Staphylococcus aureus TaxID=1280 RepID=UPI00065BAA43
AGLVTIFSPSTTGMSKAMLPILDKPTIQYFFEDAGRAGIEDVIIVTGLRKRAIEEHFDSQKVLGMVLKEKCKSECLLKVQYSTELA